MGRNGQNIGIRDTQKNWAQYVRVLDSLLFFYDNKEGMKSGYTKCRLRSGKSWKT